ncbi:LysR substrate-binding domain-containing protein [Oribacterium sp. WCC10]|uniref:LysR substrate-binding domain-containing protein n=1 Tax=Oribacterium sp. WCC10 TaxID=1855343 RepID=UPI0008E81B58|nr:LysR substrate-binding domain-containing protein [Oribacterium sp. WCC10]SFG06853.1 DNA-binding transcriptional regulator, LysR family [Oribacterium sp. WCC10]
MDYQVFLDLSALKEYKTFTLAANHRGCLQSTLSRRILAEESQLECNLFERKSHELTYAGKLYLRYGVRLRRILSELKNYRGDEKQAEEALDFRAFSYVYEIHETGSITRAAENLYISQPALTQYLNSLERKLGRKLVCRHRGHCEFTEEGLRYITIVETARKIDRGFRTELDTHLRRISHKIRIALSRQTGSLMISRVLSTFLEEFPHIQIDITEADTDRARELLLKDSVDMAILVVPGLSGGSLKYTEIYMEELKLITPLDLKEKYPGPVPLEKLDGERFILQQEFTAVQHIVSAALNQHNCSPDVICRINLFRAMANMVASGAGVALLPDHALLDYGKDCHSVSLDPPIHYYLVYAIHDETKCSEAMKRLMELLKE